LPINPMYAEAVAKVSGEGGSNDYPKHPNFKFKDIGDKVVGAVVKVGDPFTKINEWKGETREVVVQVIELENATITRTPVDDDTPGAEEFFPKLNVWIQKNGEKAAVGVELMRLDLSDIPVGYTFGFKWTGLGQAVGDGARPHKFAVRLAPPTS
jgi:hypothetical protein